MGCRVLLALLVLHRAKLLASNQSILALWRSPPYRSSAICTTASCSGFVRLTASILAWSRGGSPSNIAPARMPGVYAKRLYAGRIQVVEQSRCRTHRQQTTTIAQMQSQPSIHSFSRGKGFRQGCRDRTLCGLCRTQSPQSVLKGIENSHYLIKQTFSTSWTALNERFILSPIIIYRITAV